jgi:hypothetical protein
MNVEKQILNKLGEAWDLYYDLFRQDQKDGVFPNRDNRDDFRKAIHDAQRIVSTEYFKKFDPTFFDGKEEPKKDEPVGFVGIDYNGLKINLTKVDHISHPEGYTNVVDEETQKFHDAMKKAFHMEDEPLQKPPREEDIAHDFAEGYEDLQTSPQTSKKALRYMDVEQFRSITGYWQTPQATLEHWMRRREAFALVLEGMDNEVRYRIIKQISELGYEI